MEELLTVDEYSSFQKYLDSSITSDPFNEELLSKIDRASFKREAEGSLRVIKSAINGIFIEATRSKEPSIHAIEGELSSARNLEKNLSLLRQELVAASTEYCDCPASSGSVDVEGIQSQDFDMDDAKHDSKARGSIKFTDDSGEAPMEIYTNQNGRQLTTTTTPEQPKTKLEMQKESTEKNQNFSDQGYGMGMHRAKYRALQEKMLSSQLKVATMLQDQSEEHQRCLEDKSMLERQLSKLQHDYDELRKEHQALKAVSKLQQGSILELLAQSRELMATRQYIGDE